MSDLVQETHDQIKNKGFPYYPEDKKWKDDKYNLLMSFKVIMKIYQRKF